LATGFHISNAHLRHVIRLEEIKKLRLHEEILPEILSEVTEIIRAEGFVRHPLIVDLKTLVVLDGVHRAAAVESLGCRYIPICLLDYEDPRIILDCWYRTVNHSSNLENLVNNVSEMGFTVEDYPKETALKLLEERRATTAIISRTGCLLVRGPQKTIREIYEAIKQIELKLKSKGFLIDYDTETDAQKRVFSNEILAALMVPNVSKKEVIENALAGKAFVHKTTRHVIPSRPLFINVPIKLLYGELDLNEANKHLVAHLSMKRRKHLPSGQVLDRRYYEDVYVFE